MVHTKDSIDFLLEFLKNPLDWLSANLIFIPTVRQEFEPHKRFSVSFVSDIFSVWVVRSYPLVFCFYVANHQTYSFSQSDNGWNDTKQKVYRNFINRIPFPLLPDKFHSIISFKKGLKSSQTKVYCYFNIRLNVNYGPMFTCK